MAWGEELTTVALQRGPAPVGYAYLLTGDLDGARDLVQEALVRTYGRPRTASDLAWVEAYVRRVILNIYLDADPATRTADQVDVQAALQTLPPRKRACVVLRFYDDLTVPRPWPTAWVSARARPSDTCPTASGAWGLCWVRSRGWATSSRTSSQAKPVEPAEGAGDEQRASPPARRPGPDRRRRSRGARRA